MNRLHEQRNRHMILTHDLLVLFSWKSVSMRNGWNGWETVVSIPILLISFWKFIDRWPTWSNIIFYPLFVNSIAHRLVVYSPCGIFFLIRYLSFLNCFITRPARSIRFREVRVTNGACDWKRMIVRPEITRPKGCLLNDFSHKVIDWRPLYFCVRWVIVLQNTLIGDCCTKIQPDCEKAWHGLVDELITKLQRLAVVLQNKRNEVTARQREMLSTTHLTATTMFTLAETMLTLITGTLSMLS